MAHEGLVGILIVLGVLLLIGYILGPSKEVRAMKRTEAKAMLIPTAIILFILAAIIFSGLLDPIS